MKFSENSHLLKCRIYSLKYLNIVILYKRNKSVIILKYFFVSVPEKNLELRQERIADESLKVLCSAEGVFPTPNMSLHMGNRYAIMFLIYSSNIFNIF